jgi:hypothetical protein
MTIMIIMIALVQLENPNPVRLQHFGPANPLS